jgi:hypothetical protein
MYLKLFYKTSDVGGVFTPETVQNPPTTFDGDLTGAAEAVFAAQPAKIQIKLNAGDGFSINLALVAQTSWTEHAASEQIAKAVAQLEEWQSFFGD